MARFIPYIIAFLVMTTGEIYSQYVLKPINDGPYFNHLPSSVSVISTSDDTLTREIKVESINLNEKAYALFLGDAEIQEVQANGKTYFAGKYQNTCLLHEKWDYRHFVIPTEDLVQGLIQVRGYNLSKNLHQFTPVLFQSSVVERGIVELIAVSKPGIIFTIIFLGSIFIFLIYSIGMTIQTRNPDFRFYGYYLGAILLHNAVQADAYLKIFALFPEHPIWYHYLNEFLQMFIYAFFIMFIKVFLELEVEKRGMIKLVNGSIVATIVFAFTFLITAFLTRNFSLIQNYLSILWLVVALLGIIIVIGVYRKSKNPVRHYILIGSVLLLAGSILELYTSLMLEGGYNWNLYAIPEGGWNPFNYTQLAILGEIVCFALGIGKKIRLRDEHMSSLQARQITDLRSKEEFQAVERALLQKELDGLRSQMNPHFLFNSMTSVNDYIMREDPQSASKYLTKFAKLMRGILNNSRKKDISLREELETLNLYVELEQLRSRGGFEFQLAVDPILDIDQTKVPSMMIQPYVENAIKHGLSERRDGSLQLRIEQERDGRLKIIIEDNGIGRVEALKKRVGRPSHGMAITGDRIDLLNKIYDVNTEVRIIDLDSKEGPAGTRVEIEMDVINKI